MGSLLSAVRQRALARGWPGFSFFQPRPSHQVSPPGSRGTEPLHSRRARGLVLLWNTVRGESRPSGQQGTRVQDLPVRASVASSATVHREGFQFSSNKEDFSSRRTQEDNREGKSLIPKTQPNQYASVGSSLEEPWWEQVTRSPLLIHFE